MYINAHQTCDGIVEIYFMPEVSEIQKHHFYYVSTKLTFDVMELKITTLSQVPVNHSQVVSRLLVGTVSVNNTCILIKTIDSVIRSERFGHKLFLKTSGHLFPQEREGIWGPSYQSGLGSQAK